MDRGGTCGRREEGEITRCYFGEWKEGKKEARWADQSVSTTGERIFGVVVCTKHDFIHIVMSTFMSFVRLLLLLLSFRPRFHTFFPTFLRVILGGTRSSPGFRANFVDDSLSSLAQSRRRIDNKR